MQGSPERGHFALLQGQAPVGPGPCTLQPCTEFRQVDTAESPGPGAFKPGDYKNMLSKSGEAGQSPQEGRTESSKGNKESPTQAT